MCFYYLNKKQNNLSDNTPIAIKFSKMTQRCILLPEHKNDKLNKTIIVI